MSQAIPINLLDSFEQLALKTEEGSPYAYENLSEFRDGAAFITIFEGTSPWERHANGDELVYISEGQTKMVLSINGEQQTKTLSSGDLIVVPENTWHRFETRGVKLLSLTPLPTDVHSGNNPPAD